MNSIETIICVILLLMGVPDLCRKLGRPALANAVFVLFGMALSPLIESSVTSMLIQAGKVGFLLVLFEVGLEIELPAVRKFLRPLGFATSWSLIQYPLILGLATLSGLSLAEALIAAAAMTGCSLSMAYPGWKHARLDPAERPFVLHVMVALEMVAIVVLAVGTTALGKGFGWLLLAKLAGIAVTVFLISRFANRLVGLFQQVIEQTTHWRIHFLVLLVFVICAAGERLGLAAEKTAFFLGLFMSRARHAGMHIEEYIAPISRRFLIPIFFVSLGLFVEWRALLTWPALVAFSAAFLLIGFREFLNLRWFPIRSARQAYLLFCPNLAIAALASKSLIENGKVEAATWTTLCGVFLTVTAILMLPRAEDNKTESPAASAEAATPS